MDWKMVVIGALVVAAVLLGGVVTNGLKEKPAYGQGGVYSTYLAVSADVQERYSNFVILDTETRRLLIYRVDIVKLTLEPVAGRRLDVDFKHTAP
jgi:hypothetical protein